MRDLGRALGTSLVGSLVAKSREAFCRVRGRPDTSTKASASSGVNAFGFRGLAGKSWVFWFGPLAGPIQGARGPRLTVASIGTLASFEHQTRTVAFPSVLLVRGHLQSGQTPYPIG